MVTTEKLIRLGQGSCFDSMGWTPSKASRQGRIDLEKVYTLGRATCHDICASTSSQRRVKGDDRVGLVLPSGICHSYTSSGRCVSLFKTLYTNRCHHDCGYCSNAASCARGDTCTYTPRELAHVTLSLYRGNYIEGLFLSSGAGRDEDSVMEDLVETARILREVHRFMGYIHLKVLPGASRDLIHQAMSFADRVSINLEAPSSSRMAEICHTKDYGNDILHRQRYIKDLMRQVPLPAGQTTQMVVGAAEENDVEIFRCMMSQYKNVGTRRVYFSAFTPVKGSRFSARVPQPSWRERRLYQVDWLYRVYHLPSQEIVHAFDEDGFLENCDPKEAIAGAVLEGPLDVNTASYHQLIRVPGIGPLGARRIMALRRKKPVLRRRELATLGIRRRAYTYLILDGRVGTTLDRWSPP